MDPLVSILLMEKESKKKKKLVLDNFVLASPQSGLTVYDPMKNEKTFANAAFQVFNQWVVAQLALKRKKERKIVFFCWFFFLLLAIKIFSSIKYYVQLLF